MIRDNDAGIGHIVDSRVVQEPRGFISGMHVVSGRVVPRDFLVVDAAGPLANCQG